MEQIRDIHEGLTWEQEGASEVQSSQNESERFIEFSYQIGALPENAIFLSEALT
jgi:hypothetical protein